MSIVQIQNKMIKQLKTQQIHATIANAVSTLVSMFVPYYISRMIDGLTVPNRSIIMDMAYILIFVFAGFFLDWYQNYEWFKMIYKGGVSMRTMIFEELMKNDYSFFIKNKNGDIINRLMNDAAQFAEGTLIAVPMVILNGLKLFVTFIFIFNYNVPIGIVIFGICVLYFIIYKYINQKLKIYAKEERKGYSALLQTSTNFYKGISTICLFAKEAYFLKKYTNKVIKLGEQNIHLQFWKSLSQSLSGFVVDLMPVAAIICGIIMTIKGQCSIGAIFGIYAFTSYLGEPIRNLTDFNIILQQSKVNKDRLQEVIKDASENDNKKLLQDSISEIKLENISYSYDEGKEVLSNFNLEIKKGDRIGIVGNSGCGKSTLLHILTGELVQNSGNIFVNGEKRDLAELRRKIAVLPQEVFLYDDPILKNIQFGRDKKVSEQLIELLKIDYFSTRDVAELSGGEKRRVGLARALESDYEMLILDEPTAEIDERMEKRIIQYLDQIISEQKILIVITHQPRILEICNKTIRI